MEKFKEPVSLLTLVNSVGLLGTSAYFYKQLEGVRSDMTKMSQTITGLLRKVTELEKNEQNKGEGLHTLSDQVKRIHEQLEDAPTYNMLDDLEMDLSEIVSVLGEKSIATIDRPSAKPRRGSTRNSRREPTSYERGDRDRDRDRDRGDRDRDRDRDDRTRDRDRGDRGDRDRDRDRDDRSRDRKDTRKDPPPQQRSKPQPQYDDDEALIGDVRRQTGR